MLIGITLGQLVGLYSYKKDIKYLTNNIKKELLLAYQVINTNESNKNELFNSIVNRLQEKTN